MFQNIREKTGISLIALIVTIVILIILAGVLINISLGNNRLFNKAKTAKEMYTNAQEYEQTQIAKTSNEIDSYVDGNRNLTQTQLIPYISKVYTTTSTSVDYTYTITENSTYLVGIMEGHRSNIPEITTTGHTIFNELIRKNNDTRKCKIAIISGKSGDSITLNGANGEGTQYYAKNLTAFIYRLENINVQNIHSSEIANDATATLNYTAEKDREKVMFVAIANTLNRDVSISYSQTGKFSGAMLHDNYIYVDYAVLDKDETVNVSAYGYNWGGGTAIIIK